MTLNYDFDLGYDDDEEDDDYYDYERDDTGYNPYDDDPLFLEMEMSDEEGIDLGWQYRLANRWRDVKATAEYYLQRWSRRINPFNHFRRCEVCGKRGVYADGRCERDYIPF